MKIVLMGIGTVSFILGIVGIFLPILPTVPFVLLSLICFSKSSKRIHNYLMKYKFVRDCMNTKNGITTKRKIYIVILSNLLMIISILLVNNLIMNIFLFLLIIIKDYIIFFKIPTLKL